MLQAVAGFEYFVIFCPSTVVFRMQKKRHPMTSDILVCQISGRHSSVTRNRAWFTNPWSLVLNLGCWKKSPPHNICRKYPVIARLYPLFYIEVGITTQAFCPIVKCTACSWHPMDADSHHVWWLNTPCFQCLPGFRCAKIQLCSMLEILTSLESS